VFFVSASLLVGIVYWKPLPGLSIDDSYIFLQYAKNLAERGELSFNAGDHSFGITSFTWTVLLAVAHWVSPGHSVAATHILGAILLGISASFWTATFRRLGAGWILSSLVGLALVTDPFLVGHSISGMESALNLAMFSALVWYTSQPTGSANAIIGMLIAFAYLTRPDNLVSLPAFLIAPLIGTPTDGRHSLRTRLAEWITILAGFAVIFLPFAAWSYLRIGSIIPPTRIGKLLVFLPVHYGFTLEQFNSLGPEGHLRVALQCLTQRILPMFTTQCERTVLPVILTGICALPILAMRRGQHRLLCSFLSLYAIGLVLCYALFFPLVKDRHLTNLHSVAIAGVGMLALYLTPRNPAGGRSHPSHRWKAALSSSPLIVEGLLCISIVGSLLFLNHYRAEYLRRVANINVWCATGKWFGSHAPFEARIALEPMGAVKYCSQMYVLDMGGLATRDTWQSISQGQGGGLDSINQLLRSERIDYVVDHHPIEWLGRLADKFPEDYHLVASVEPSSRDRVYGATDRFDIFATHWGIGAKHRETAGQRMP
jgi:hypothetical protein